MPTATATITCTLVLLVSLLASTFRSVWSEFSSSVHETIKCRNDPGYLISKCRQCTAGDSPSLPGQLHKKLRCLCAEFLPNQSSCYCHCIASWDLFPKKIYCLLFVSSSHYLLLAQIKKEHIEHAMFEVCFLCKG